MPRKRTTLKTNTVPAGGERGVLATALSGVPGISTRWDADACVIAWKHLDVVLRLYASRVIRHQRVVDPFGQPAELLLLNVHGIPVQVAISGSDLVFEPDESVRVGELEGPAIHVVDMPQMVGYSEVLRDLDVLQRALDTEPNIDRLFGFAARLRYFIAGAERIGLDCGDLMARWGQLWERLSVI